RLADQVVYARPRRVTARGRSALWAVTERVDHAPRAGRNRIRRGRSSTPSRAELTGAAARSFSVTPARDGSRMDDFAAFDHHRDRHLHAVGAGDVPYRGTLPPPYEPDDEWALSRRA